MSGLQKILKIHGRVKVGDVYWCWDYKNDCPRKESEMTEAEIKANKKAHKGKGILHRIGEDKIEWGNKSSKIDNVEATKPDQNSNQINNGDNS